MHDIMKRRLSRNRPMTTISMRIPIDMVDSMKIIAPEKGIASYQTLAKMYIAQGLREDEAKYVFSAAGALRDILDAEGIDPEVALRITKAVQAKTPIITHRNDE
jgi:hypothetical protein